MFDEYKKHLIEENEWLKKQIEELQAKLFKAMRLDIVSEKPLSRMKWNEIQKNFVEMSPEEIHQESQALQDLLSQNVDGFVDNTKSK